MSGTMADATGCSVAFISTLSGVLLSCRCGWKRHAAFGPQAFRMELAHLRTGYGLR